MWIPHQVNPITLLLKATSKDDQRHRGYSRVKIWWKPEMFHCHYNYHFLFAITSFKNCFPLYKIPYFWNHLSIKISSLTCAPYFYFPCFVCEI